LPEEPYTDRHGRERLRTTIWLPRGIVIPWFADNHLWKIQIRRPAGDPRYYTLPGQRNGLFNADAIKPGQGAMLVEGAFDAIAVQQEAGDLVAAVATGSTGARATRWILRIARCTPLLLGFDADQGGNAPATFWKNIFPGARRCTTITNDPAEMLQRGLSLRSWVQLTLGQQQEEVSA
jgi:hypothetical protein